MDLQHVRSLLTPAQSAEVDLNAAWREYRGGGGIDETDAFLSWITAQLLVAELPHHTSAGSHIQTSQVLPTRFASQADDALTLADSAAPTVLADRSHGPAAPPAPIDSPVQAVAADFHYELIGTAGKGGMGTVHIAKDTELLRRVALKQLNPEADAVANARTRFLREAQITAQLDHPNIVPVYALEVAPDGAPAYTMKFVEGTTFHALLNEARTFFEEKRLPDEAHNLPARIEHFLKVCDAMSYAHDKGVIHRDLKPANLMLGRHNEVYVMDWGLCRAMRQPDDALEDRSVVISSADVSGSASETQLGDVVGTPKYMSPEQAQGRNEQLDARSDQCALGLILFELVTLEPPYPGRTAYEVLVNAAAGKRRPVVHAFLGKRIPRELIAIIERATMLSPDERYGSVGDMAADLRRYTRGEAVQAKPDAFWQRAQRWIVRHRQAALTTVLATIALAAIAIGGLLWQNQQMFKAERLREQRLLGLSSAVADVSDRVQMRLLQIEGGIENLADSVEQILAHGQESDQRFYLRRDFDDPQRTPDDLQPSSTHNGKVSLRWPVWTMPPEVNETEAIAQIRKLAVLQPFMREIYARSAHMIEGDDQDFYAHREHALRNDSSPLNAVLIALDDGVAARYPGWDGLPAGYDPHTRPWYVLALNKQGPQWGLPYLSAATGERELPLSIPLYNGQKRLIGVVSAAFLPDLLVKSLFQSREGSAIRAMYLLDRDSHILAATGDLVVLEQAAPDENSSQIFPLPELARRVKAGQTGILETQFHDMQVVVAYDEVTPFGWSVVAVADARRLLKSTDEDTSGY